MPKNLKDIRRSVLKQRNVQFKPRTKTLTTQDDMPAVYHKTRLMQYVELKYSKPIDTIIWEGTIDEVAAKYDIDRSTVSKWRKQIEIEKEEHQQSKFFERFS